MFVHTAQLLLSLTKACTEQVQTRVQSRVLPTLVGLGPGDARRLVESTTLEVEPRSTRLLTAERRARARRRRRVWVSADPDGMGAVTGTMTAEQLRRWTLDFEELVRAQKLADRDAQVERTADQRRADVFAELPSRQLALIQALQEGTVAELLPETAEPVVAEPEPTEPVEVPDRLAGMSVEQLGVELVRLPVRNPQVINVHIPMTAVLEIDHRPGVLEGYGAVSAEHVRLMVPVSGLRQLWVDGRTGVPLAAGEQVLDPEPDPQRSRDRLLTLLGPHVVVHGSEPRHDPSDRLAGSVQLRDQRCTGIGCERHAAGCDLDHELRYPDGPTAYWNLSAKSRRCHRP